MIAVDLQPDLGRVDGSPD